VTTAERVCGSYTATTVTLVRYLTCMRRPGRPFSARPVLFASSCAGARVRLGPAAAPGGIRIMINHRALAWSGEVPLRAHFDTIACLASVLKFARCSPFRFGRITYNRIGIRFTCTMGSRWPPLFLSSDQG
jgi:hypothetical protein